MSKLTPKRPAAFDPPKCTGCGEPLTLVSIWSHDTVTWTGREYGDTPERSKGDILKVFCAKCNHQLAEDGPEEGFVLEHAE